MQNMKMIVCISCFTLWCVVFSVFPITPSQADTPPAVPVAGVQKKVLAHSDNTHLAVVELFSCETCPFAKRAQENLAALLADQNLIVLSCPVNYFTSSQDQGQGPCETRQTAYAQTLRTGPNYSPQMIINGTHDANGARVQDIGAKLRQARLTDLPSIKIEPKPENTDYRVSLPEISARPEMTLEILLIGTPDKPGLVDNIVAPASWGGAAQNIEMSVITEAYHQGFIVLARDKTTGQVYAAGEYTRG